MSIIGIRDALAGRKTYIIAIFMVMIGVVNLITGDVSTSEFFNSDSVRILLEGLGLGALRAGIAKK